MTTQLTFFSPPPAVPVAPVAAVPSGRFYRDGQFTLPEGERQPPKGLFCVMDIAGAPLDALRILVVHVQDRDRNRMGVEVPALNRGWEAGGDWVANVHIPSQAAILSFAVAEMGLPPEAVRPLCYTTSAWRGENRAVIRDAEHLGPIRERVERRNRR